MKILTVIGLLISTFSIGQSLEIDGKWKGATKAPGGILSVKAEIIEETKGKYKGIFYFKSVPVKDSTAYIAYGTLKENRLTFVGKKFLYKVGPGCLAKIVLDFEAHGNSFFLNGKWKPNLKIGGCLPGFSGEMSLEKVIEFKKMPIASSKPIATVQSLKNEDEIGKLLQERLRSTEYHALIIGINNYDAEGIETLNRPEQDAKTLANTLYGYYGFKEENIDLLLSPDRTQIIKAFESLSARVEVKDNVVIFYAGHGIWLEDSKQGYWLPSDSDTESRANWLSNGTIRDLVRSIQSKHTLLIADACFSGAMLKERNVYLNSKAVLEMYNHVSRKAITSGTLQTVPDNSVFFEYLNKRLIEQEAPFLTAGELFNSFKIAVINNSSKSQLPQYGAIGQAGDEGGDFIFLRQ